MLPVDNKCSVEEACSRNSYCCRCGERPVSYTKNNQFDNQHGGNSTPLIYKGSIKDAKQSSSSSAVLYVRTPPHSSSSSIHHSWRHMFANKHALITGGSEGLGLALAKQLAAQNARVTLIARTLSKLQAAEQQVLQCCPQQQGSSSSQQQQVYTHSADVTKYRQVRLAQCMAISLWCSSQACNACAVAAAGGGCCAGSRGSARPG